MVWVDDTPDWVDSVIEEIKEHIEDIGFTPNINRLVSGEGFPESCSSVDLDLIIVDYNLPDGKNGDLLISELRANGVFKEIVFYSQQQPPKELIGVTDGVFHSSRENAVDTIKKVIDLTVHKFRDLEIVRGLVIASTIDLEVKLEELMIVVFGDCGKLFQEKVLEKPVYDFAKKLRFIQSYFKDIIEQVKDEKEKTKLNVNYDKLQKFLPEVIAQRNILAHARKTTVDGKITLKSNESGKRIVFGEDWLSDTRKKLREHMENLQEIEEVLKN